MRIELYGIETIVARAILIKEIGELKAKLAHLKQGKESNLNALCEANRRLSENGIVLAKIGPKGLHNETEQFHARLNYDHAIMDLEFIKSTHKEIESRINKIEEEIEFKTKSLSFI